MQTRSEGTRSHYYLSVKLFKKVLAATLVGHTDAVWDLAAWQGAFSGASATHRDHLLSVSADGSVKLWDPLAQVQFTTDLT